MANRPRLSVLDKLLTSTGFATIGKVVRDSILALGTTEEAPQDKFTVFEYRHVHRDDWRNLCAAARRWLNRLRHIVWRSSSVEDDSSSPSVEGFVHAPLRKEPELRLRTYPYMIFPISPGKMIWDYFIMLLVAYNAVELPYSIAFDYVPCNEDSLPIEDGSRPKMCPNSSFTVLMILTDVMFWVDVVLSFRTGVIDSRQVIHMQPKFAALHYVRTWLVVDVISSFPFEAIVFAMTTQGTTATFMLARLFKLPRLMRTARIIKKFHQLSKTTAFQLSYVLFCTFTLAHWAACGFFFLARWEIDNIGANEFTGGLTWIEVPAGSNDPPRAYIDADANTRYAAALYWAVTTMSTTGYGDILPMTNLERSYALVVMLIGVVVSALVFGVLGQIITDAFDSIANGAQSQNQVLASVKELAADMRLEPALVRRLQNTVKLQFHRHGGIHLGAMLNTPEVSRSIREDVLMHVYGSQLQECEAFRDCSVPWLRALVQVLEPVVLLEADAVFLAAELPSHLHLLTSGTVLLHRGHEAVVTQNDSRLLVGPVVLDLFATVQDQPHQYSVTARTNCDLLVAQGEVLRGLLRIFKADAAVLSRFALQCHSARLALLGVSPLRRPKTAFVGIPEHRQVSSVGGPRHVWSQSDSGAPHSRGALGIAAGAASLRAAPPSDHASGHGSHADPDSVVAFMSPPHVPGSGGGSVAHGTRLTAWGGQSSRVDEAAHMQDEGMAALMDRMDDLARLQDELCEQVVGLSLQMS
eukprot:jgi/Ulvmu1/1190/UM108_0018.1